MLRVYLKGEKWLPADVNARRLAVAAIRVGEMLGVNGTVELFISPHFSRCRGLAVRFDDGSSRIVLFSKFIKDNARQRGWTMAYLYSCTLAHEMVHVAQYQRNAKGLKNRTCEAEAMALEDVYGPEVEKVLRRNA
jgi:hypothetical protein